MSPKSLLRHKECVSKIADFTDNEFWSVIDDSSITKKNTKRIILCSGKVYYELKTYRTEHKIKDTALLRVEQLYPFNSELLKKLINKYPKHAEIVWCQEEPKNMGGWSFIAPRLTEALERPVRYAGRRSAASPASGSLARHKYEQNKLIKAAFNIPKK